MNVIVTARRGFLLFNFPARCGLTARGRGDFYGTRDPRARYLNEFSKDQSTITLILFHYIRII